MIYHFLALSLQCKNNFKFCYIRQNLGGWSQLTEVRCRIPVGRVLYNTHVFEEAGSDLAEVRLLLVEPLLQTFQ